MNSFDVSALLWGGLLLQKCYVLLYVNSEQLKVLVTSHLISYMCELENLHLDVQENVQPVELENLKRVFKWPGTQMEHRWLVTVIALLFLCRLQGWRQDPLCLCPSWICWPNMAKFWAQPISRPVWIDFLCKAWHQERWQNLLAGDNFALVQTYKQLT